MRSVRALILTGFGINCEEEMRAAYALAGADADIVHLKDIFLERVSIFDYDILNFPGGFSFGDDLGAGRVLANRLKYKKLASGERFFNHLKVYLDHGGYIFGVCNGFQALVTLGLLPGLGVEGEQQASLIVNDSEKFEDRWVRCSVPANNSCSLLAQGSIIDLPVRHREGKLVIEDQRIAEEVIDKGLIALQYVDAAGQPTQSYPQNPNGSFLSCAALSNPTGQVLGMMPHPEAYLSIYNHPNWGEILRHYEDHHLEGEGLALFKNFIHGLQPIGVYS